MYRMYGHDLTYSCGALQELRLAFRASTLVGCRLCEQQSTRNFIEEFVEANVSPTCTRRDRCFSGTVSRLSLREHSQSRCWKGWMVARIFLLPSDGGFHTSPPAPTAPNLTQHVTNGSRFREQHLHHTAFLLSHQHPIHEASTKRQSAHQSIGTSLPRSSRLASSAPSVRQ